MKIINPLRLRACEKPPKVATALVSPFLGDVGTAGPAQPFWNPAGCSQHLGVLGDTVCSKWH